MRVEAPRELEAKFSLDNQAELDNLVGRSDLPDGFTISDSTTVTVSDAYLDTGDMRLLRHGYTLRLRKKGAKRLITLKSLEEMHGGYIQDRLEIEKPLAPGSQVFGLLGWPKDIRRIVVEIAGKKPQLQSICIVQQTRRKEWLNNRLSQSPVAELSLDQVAVSDGEGKVDTSGNGGSNERIAAEPAGRFYEVELELLHPDQEPAFLTLVEWLETRPALSPLKSSKLVSGLRAIAAQPLNQRPDRPVDDHDNRSGIQPEMKMADACRLIWRQQMIEMNLNESGVRADQDIEYVHDMRVATRRARAAYVLFGEDFKRKRVRTHVEFFKRTAQALGAVRDLDVALKKLRAYRRGLPGDERRALKAIAKHWRKERRQQIGELHRWLESDAYALALIELDAFCRTPNAGVKQQNDMEGEPPVLVEVRHRLPSQILAYFAAVRRYEIIFAGEEPPPLTTLHALRIDCKYLRYVLEFARDLLGPEGDVLIAQLKDLQDVLGDLNDAAVARDMLLDLPKSIRNEAALTYIREQETISNNLRAHVASPFATFVDFENRLRLTTALAHL